MAHELQLEWWRPQEADAPVAARETEQPETDIGESTLPFWSLMGFTGILLFAPQSYFPSLAPLRPALLLMTLGVLSYVGDRWRRGLPLIEWNRATGLIAGLSALAAVTVPFALWPGGSLSVLIEFMKTALVFLLLSHVITTTDRLRRVAWILTCMAMGLGLFALYNAWTGDLVKEGLDQERVLGNQGSLTRNPNDLALMVNLLLPLTIGLLLSAEQVWQRLLLFGAIGMDMLTVVLTRSRTGALTLMVIILAYLWKLRHRRERGWIYGLILAAIMAVPLLPSSYLDRLSTITNVQADQVGSAQARLSDMITAVKMIAANPIIGAGMGMNVLAMREERGGWIGVHNVYLEHAVDLGLPGLAIFLALLMSCITSVAGVRRYLVSTELSSLADAIHVSLIAYAAAAMFHPISYHYYFYYIAGLAIAAGRIARAQTDHTLPVTP
ncbi:MAG TPA: O-antigen ligase family protein [Nitrospira sp.]|nr:O-antigen ligase family protein [Nitrospira sp.]